MTHSTSSLNTIAHIADEETRLLPTISCLIEVNPDFWPSFPAGDHVDELCHVQPGPQPFGCRCVMNYLTSLMICTYVDM